MILPSLVHGRDPKILGFPRNSGRSTSHAVQVPESNVKRRQDRRGHPEPNISFHMNRRRERLKSMPRTRHGGDWPSRLCWIPLSRERSNTCARVRGEEPSRLVVFLWPSARDAAAAGLAVGHDTRHVGQRLAPRDGRPSRACTRPSHAGSRHKRHTAGVARVASDRSPA